MTARGRPKTPNVRMCILTLRFRLGELAVIASAAQSVGKPRATWIRETLLESAEK